MRPESNPSCPGTKRPRAAAWLLLLAAGAVLTGCASGNPFSFDVPYRCDNGLTLSLNSRDDSVVMQGGRGSQLLLRDAGGVGDQAVYSNPEARLITGLGPDGRNAELEGMIPNSRARCTRS